MKNMNQIYDKEQIKFMEEDMCIIVNEKDEIIGKDSKKNCHLTININNGLLHRAFSVFLFNKEKKLLLQQRSDEKITFPAAWTNTCCSHPLYNEPNERSGVEGVKLAAQRKLFHELGIKASEIPLDKFYFLTRIHYKAVDSEQWGEHEIDYILFIIVNSCTIQPNYNEVKDYRFVTMEETKKIIEDAKKGIIKITPWFQLIFHKFLFNWWEKIEKGISIESDSNIYHL